MATSTPETPAVRAPADEPPPDAGAKPLDTETVSDITGQEQGDITVAEPDSPGAGSLDSDDSPPAPEPTETVFDRRRRERMGRVPKQDRAGWFDVLNSSAVGFDTIKTRLSAAETVLEQYCDGPCDTMPGWDAVAVKQIIEVAMEWCEDGKKHVGKERDELMKLSGSDSTPSDSTNTSTPENESDEPARNRENINRVLDSSQDDAVEFLASTGNLNSGDILNAARNVGAAKSRQIAESERDVAIRRAGLRAGNWARLQGVGTNITRLVLGERGQDLQATIGESGTKERRPSRTSPAFCSTWKPETNSTGSSRKPSPRTKSVLPKC